MREVRAGRGLQLVSAATRRPSSETDIDIGGCWRRLLDEIGNWRKAGGRQGFPRRAGGMRFRAWGAAVNRGLQDKGGVALCRHGRKEGLGLERESGSWRRGSRGGRGRAGLAFVALSMRCFCPLVLFLGTVVGGVVVVAVPPVGIKKRWQRRRWSESSGRLRCWWGRWRRRDRGRRYALPGCRSWRESCCRYALTFRGGTIVVGVGVDGLVGVGGVCVGVDGGGSDGVGRGGSGVAVAVAVALILVVLVIAFVDAVCVVVVLVLVLSP